VSRRAVSLLGWALTLAACGGGDTPDAQLARGAAVYAQSCGTCHDVSGGIGVALTTRVIGSYGTADRLLRYLRIAMPYGAPGSLDVRAYRDVVAYLASDRGRRAVPLIVDSAAAARVPLAGLP
jgi:mono/diheme cytochrome c family protein